MFSKSTWQHLRIPFSLYLMPIYCFAISTSEVFVWQNALISFVAIHLFLYPASNGYNSFFDKDEDSIGGLEKPPPVQKELYYAALAFDAFAILLGLLISWQFAGMLLLYGLVSKAYSWDGIRLKKYPIAGWIVVCVFQGAFTYLMVKQAHLGLPFAAFAAPEHALPTLLSTAMLLGSYPMTQIYQHQEDARRGDLTLSRLLGIQGTFLFTAVFFGATTAGFIFYFQQYFSTTIALLFPVFLAPVLAFFGYWFWKVRNDAQQANFRHTMRLNQLSAVCLNLFFIALGIFR